MTESRCAAVTSGGWVGIPWPAVAPGGWIIDHHPGCRSIIGGRGHRRHVRPVTSTFLQTNGSNVVSKVSRRRVLSSCRGAAECCRGRDFGQVTYVRRARRRSEPNGKFPADVGRRTGRPCRRGEPKSARARRNALGLRAGWTDVGALQL